jgi:hypothetical protein
MSWDADGEGQTVGRTGGCLSEVTRIDMRGIGCDMANCSPSEGNAGTVEKGSGTVKIFATTMSRKHTKRAKVGNGRGQRSMAQVVVQELTASISQLGPIATGPASSPWRRPAEQ